jgi:hypothetical protein
LAVEATSTVTSKVAARPPRRRREGLRSIDGQTGSGIGIGLRGERPGGRGGGDDDQGGKKNE